MGKYAVYLEITNRKAGKPCKSKVMVFDVDSTSCGGAEHKILDLSPLCTNALAFEIGKDDNTDYFKTLLINSMHKSFKEFCISIRNSENLRADALEEIDAEIEYDRKQVTDLDAEIQKRKAELSRLENSLKAWKEYYAEDMQARKEFIETYGEFYNMPYGIA